MVEILFTMIILGFALSDLYWIRKDWKKLEEKNNDNLPEDSI